MGTRGAFFTADPRQENSRWLGCLAWDSHQSTLLPLLRSATSRKEFIELIDNHFSQQDDFTDPSKHGWPFPWNDDIFLTDYCYWWDDEQGVVWTYFHRGPFSVAEGEKLKSLDSLPDRPLPKNVAISRPYDKSAPDSIMILRYDR